MRKRRGHGEGSITQRRDGRWQGRISLGWQDGKRRVKTIYGPTQEAVAKRLRKELVKRDGGREIDTAGAPTLATFAADWLETIAATLKPSTVHFYDEKLRLHILPALGHLKVTAIGRPAVVQVIRGLRRKKLGTLTIRGVTRTLSACLDAATEEHYLDVNPALGLRKHLRLADGEVHEPDPLTATEAARLVATTREQFPRWTAFVLCGLRTGLRLSELIGLDWADLDETASTVTVQRAYVRGVLGTPKNRQRRTVDVSPELLTALRTLRRAQRVFALRKGRPAPTIMFPAVGGTDRLDDSNVRKVFTRICTAAKIRAHSPHDMRDTFASLLLSQNVPLLYVSQQLGHGTAAVTLRHYARWLPSAEGAAYAARLDCVSTVCQDEAAENQNRGIS